MIAKRMSGKQVSLAVKRMDDEAIALYTTWRNDETLAHFICFRGQAQTQDEVRQALNVVDPLKVEFSVIRNATEDLIGICSLTRTHPADSRAVLSILIGDQTHRGHGYGFETVQLLLKFGFQCMNLHSIMLRVAEENVRAYNCYLKAGFKQVGLERDCIFYDGAYHNRYIMDILRSEWKELNSIESR